MAKQVLKTQDHIFASRPPMGDKDHLLSPQKISQSPYGPYWKFMRKALVLELLSTQRLNTICRMSFGKICNEDEMGGRVFKEVLDNVLALAGGFKYSDYIPLLGWLGLHGDGRRQAELTEIFHLFVGENCG